MKAILWLIIRCVFFIPLVAIHFALSILSSGSGNANWGIEQSITATGNALFGKDKDK
jgi:hypothetical protein